MTALQTAAQQALEVWDMAESWADLDRAMDALRAALEQPEPPPEAQTEAEKIAYCAGWWAAMAVTAKEQPEQKPVAWLYQEGLEALKNGKCWTAYGTKQDAQCSIPVYLNGAVAPKVEPAKAECAGFDSQPAPPAPSRPR